MMECVVRKELRCSCCGKLLGRGAGFDLEIKCPRCGELNHLRDGSPIFESRRAPTRGAACGSTSPNGREISGRDRGGESLDGPLPDGHGAGAGLFPPGPDAFDAWERLLAAQPHLQPAVLRESDGLAERLDSYRLAGNGLVPLAGAYALATLAAAGAERSEKIEEKV